LTLPVEGSGKPREITRFITVGEKKNHGKFKINKNNNTRTNLRKKLLLM
jgi:hypothetical protein